MRKKEEKRLQKGKTKMQNLLMTAGLVRETLLLASTMLISRSA